MEYKVIFTINGKRELLVLEHVKQEYGVSVSDFWCAWIGNQPHFEGDGDTAEEAITKLISNREKIELIKMQFEKSIENSEVFRTPIFDQVANNVMDATMRHFNEMNRMMRVVP